MNQPPAVSVVMPVYNAAAHLPAALDSMLAQTFADFELIVLDDGSTDDTGALLAAYAGRDARVRLAGSAENQGLIARLNQGLEQARGRYIARMDGDDTSRPERLARQVALLDAQPQLGACGSWVRVFGDAPARVERYPTDDAAIRCELLFRNALAHPATMLRGDIVRRHGLRYSTQFIHAEDYAMWLEIAAHSQLANLPEILLDYRAHAAQVGQRQRATQQASSALVRLAQLRALGIDPAPAEQATHEAISTAQIAPTRAFIAAADSWLRRLLAANRASGRLHEPSLLPVLGLRWYTVCRLSTVLGPWVWWRFQRSPLARHAPIDASRRAKFLLKALASSPTAIA